MTVKNIIGSLLSENQKNSLYAIKKVVLGETQSFDPSLKIDKNITLQNRVFISTHHKTGTVWLASVFMHICKFHGIRFSNDKNAYLTDKFDVMVDDHSNLDYSKLLAPYKGVHIIRDPRDVIVSGCFYHQKSKEAWLHRPRSDFGGLTYQQKINSFESTEEKLLFDMQYASGSTIKSMAAWDYNNSSFINVKYEDLIGDYNLTLFHEIFTFLGFPGYAIPSLLGIAHQRSIFSGSNFVTQKKHIRSGKSAQWKEHFTDQIEDKFKIMFGEDLLLKLRYEEAT